MEWFQNLSWAEIGALVMAVYGLASVIVRITPTKKDDEINSKIGKILSLLFQGTNVKK
jgi:hypothetical protein